MTGEAFGIKTAPVDPMFKAYWQARRTYRDVNFGALMAGTLPEYPSFEEWKVLR